MTRIVDISGYIPVQLPSFVTRSVSGRTGEPSKILYFFDRYVIWKHARMERIPYTEYMDLLRYTGVNPGDEAAALLCQRSLVTVPTPTNGQKSV